MANTLDAHPEVAQQVETMKGVDPHLVPISLAGCFWGFAADHVLGQRDAGSLPIADLVVGLELLGFRLEPGNDGSGLYALDPSFRLPEPWKDYAGRLRQALDTRNPQALAFVERRDRKGS